MKTLINLFEENVEKYSQNPLLWEKNSKEYNSTSYKETEIQVQRMAAGLMSLGLKKEERVALLSEGRNYWVISELAILYTGAVNVPLSVKLDAEVDLHFRLAHSGAKYVIVSRNQAAKIDKIKHDLSELEKVILLDPKDKYDDD